MTLLPTQLQSELFSLSLTILFPRHCTSTQSDPTTSHVDCIYISVGYGDFWFKNYAIGFEIQ